jgi:hypothetical protein
VTPVADPAPSAPVLTAEAASIVSAARARRLRRPAGRRARPVGRRAGEPAGWRAGGPDRRAGGPGRRAGPAGRAGGPAGNRRPAACGSRGAVDAIEAVKGKKRMARVEMVDGKEMVDRDGVELVIPAVDMAYAAETAARASAPLAMPPVLFLRFSLCLWRGGARCANTPTAYSQQQLPRRGTYSRPWPFSLRTSQFLTFAL